MRRKLGITAEMVKAEAERRITSRYPIWRQLNITDEGGEAKAEMRAFIDHVRAASNGIEARSPIPHDYAADHHWSS